MSPSPRMSPRVLPGSRPGDAPGMHPYVVNLREPKPPAKKKGRSGVVTHYEQLTDKFVKRLQGKVAKLHLEPQVGSYGEPNPFPVVTLTCSPAVAKVIEAMPEVMDVYRDDQPSLGIVE